MSDTDRSENSLIKIIRKIVLMGELQEQMTNVNDSVNKWKDNRFCIQSEAFLSMTTSKSAA